MRDFNPIEKHKLNPLEPLFAVPAFVESTGDWNEYLFITTDDEPEGGIALSPDEAVMLSEVIKRWLGPTEIGGGA